MLPDKQKQIQLVSRPNGTPVESDFHYKEIDVPRPDQGQVLVKTLYLSVDPYMRGRMSDAKSYVEPFKLNEALAGGVVGEIVDSQSEQFQKGDFVVGMLPWQEYSLASEKAVRAIDPDVAPISTHLSILGMTGLTAYFGLLDIGQPKKVKLSSYQELPVLLDRPLDRSQKSKGPAWWGLQALMKK